MKARPLENFNNESNIDKLLMEYVYYICNEYCCAELRGNTIFDDINKIQFNKENKEIIVYISKQKFGNNSNKSTYEYRYKRILVNYIDYLSRINMKSKEMAATALIRELHNIDNSINVNDYKVIFDVYL